jgi:hypothetical protein
MVSGLGKSASPVIDTLEMAGAGDTPNPVDALRFQIVGATKCITEEHDDKLSP